MVPSTKKPPEDAVARIVEAERAAPGVAGKCCQRLGLGAFHVGLEAAQPEDAAASQILATVLAIGEFGAIGRGFIFDIGHGGLHIRRCLFRKYQAAGNAPSFRL